MVYQYRRYSIPLQCCPTDYYAAIFDIYTNVVSNRVWYPLTTQVKKEQCTNSMVFFCEYYFFVIDTMNIFLRRNVSEINR